MAIIFTNTDARHCKRRESLEHNTEVKSRLWMATLISCYANHKNVPTYNWRLPVCIHWGHTSYQPLWQWLCKVKAVTQAHSHTHGALCIEDLPIGLPLGLAKLFLELGCSLRLFLPNPNTPSFPFSFTDVRSSMMIWSLFHPLDLSRLFFPVNLLNS